MTTQTIHPSYHLLSPERKRIIHYLRKWGGDTADAILDPECAIFMDPQIEGLIGYRLKYNRVVVFGDPVCALEDKYKLAQAFQEYCKKMGYKVIYAIVSEDFTKWALNSICKASIEFGERLILNPQQNPFNNTGVKGSLVRRKYRHAIKEGVDVMEYIPYDPRIEQELEDVAEAWLRSRNRFQIHISNVYLFRDCPGKRWFYAKQNGKIVGILILNQLKSSQGWLMNHLMVNPEAPHGTQELLVITAIETLGKEGYQLISFGAMTGSCLGEIQGLNPLFAWTTKTIFKIADRLFHLEGLKTFWGKFQPKSEKTYLLFSHQTLDIRSILSLMHAFNVTII